MAYDWSALTLFGVVGVGMTTSAALLIRTVVAALRRPVDDCTAPCSC